MKFSTKASEHINEWPKIDRLSERNFNILNVIILKTLSRQNLALSQSVYKESGTSIPGDEAPGRPPPYTTSREEPHFATLFKHKKKVTKNHFHRNIIKKTYKLVTILQPLYKLNTMDQNSTLKKTGKLVAKCSAIFLKIHTEAKISTSYS